MRSRVIIATNIWTTARGMCEVTLACEPTDDITVASDLKSPTDRGAVISYLDAQGRYGRMKEPQSKSDSVAFPKGWRCINYSVQVIGSYWGKHNLFLNPDDLTPALGHIDSCRLPEPLQIAAAFVQTRVQMLLGSSRTDFSVQLSCLRRMRYSVH